MEPLALLPTELTALVDPLARQAAPPLGALDGAGAPLPGADAFAQFLAAFLPPAAGGQELPAGGKPLPFALPETVAEAADAPSATAGEAAAAPAAGATTAELAVWLRVRSEAPPATAVPLEVGLEVEASSPSLARALPLTGAQASASALAAQVPGSAPPTTPVAAEPLAAAESSLLAEESPLPFELPEPAPGPIAAAEGVLDDDVSFDGLRAESRLATGQARAEGRTLAAPAAPLAATPPAAAWLAPAAEAAVQATVRTADGAPAGGRGARRIETLAVTSTAVSLGETTVAPATDWLPPVGTGGGASPSAVAAPAQALPTQAPVDTRTPQWHDAFASRVQWLVDQQVGEARIKLNPPELGAVDVKISLVEDKTYVQLTAATAAARDELAQGLPRLRDLFVASGLELGGASVQGGRGGHSGGGGYEATARYGADLPELDLPLPAETPRSTGRAAGAIDVFA